MRGHVSAYDTKAGRRWRVIYDAPPDPLTGRRRQTSKRGFKTQRDAQKSLRAILDLVDDGTYQGPFTSTVAQYLTGWVEGLRVKPSTRANYRQSIDLHLVPIKAKDGRPRPGIGGIKLRALTAEHLDTLYRWLETEGRQDAKPLAIKTIRHVHTAVRKALADAVDRGYVPRNVADLAHPPTQKQARSRQALDGVWSAEQLRAFLAASKDHRLHAAFYLTAMTGMRRAEVLGLRWADIDLDAATVRIRWTLVQIAGEMIDQDSAKTDAGERTVALDPSTVAVLRDHRRRQLEDRMASGPAWQSDVDRVFADPIGRPVRPDLLLRHLQRVAALAGLPKINVHGLRHTYATVALRAGVDVEVVSKRLGHSDIAITLNIYRHVRDTDDQAAAALAATAILGEAQ